MTSTPVVQIVFGAFYTMFLSAILRKADIWYPFTPTIMKDRQERWIGLNDCVRLALAGVFLIILPAGYLIYVLVLIVPFADQINLLKPAFMDLVRLAAIMGLIIPPLGFYSLWQAIVRSTSWFYSKKAIESIEVHYPNAFRVGVWSTLVLSVLFVAGPTALFFLIYRNR